MSLKCTPLDDYVNRPDPTYQYSVLSTWNREGYAIHNINLTSQTWLAGTCHHYKLKFESDKILTNIEIMLM